MCVCVCVYIYIYIQLCNIVCVCVCVYSSTYARLVLSDLWYAGKTFPTFFLITGPLLQDCFQKQVFV